MLALAALAADPAGVATAAPPEPNRVQLTTGDGVRIAGFWLDCHVQDAPAVLLVHNAGHDHFAFRPLWQPLQRAGMHVLALDLRGHGASRSLAPEAYQQLVRRDQAVYRAMVQDVEAGIAFLTREHGVPPGKIVIVGGELGCALGFEVMARNPRLRGMVALSPQSTAYGFTTLDAVRKYGKRPLLVVSVKRLLDEGPQQVVDALHDNRAVTLEVYPGNAVRGVQLLGLGSVERLVLDWLRIVFTSPP
jgi:alpha-beta hydrolase superfamily lysophospholipase